MNSFPACYQVFGRNFYIEPASAQCANAAFQDEYQLDDLRPHNVQSILDIGAHVGSFTVLCHHHWPDAKIVAVEPHPDSFELLQRNTAHIPTDQLLLINAAVTKQAGKTQLSSAVSRSRVGGLLRRHDRKSQQTRFGSAVLPLCELVSVNDVHSRVRSNALRAA